ncbi:LysM peptidoglycan-binding domain-containing protein [Paenibacillus sp. LMG 31461]|uniref:LysM peptidoglycan-binding domain-containing protein n=1 Tax=Paenibacillus plantarum TaxID=2654975 RepID=A0ABX1XDA4_9BACL|nr:3D domain-containing protein [Paenibacillus plantarum]NOU66438.1 LysM peptidoglycan-binding domain-containing protein [Paenibacillus plantarum]
MMFRKICISTLSFIVLLGLWFMQSKVYSYPSSFEDMSMSPVYVASSNESSDTSIAETPAAEVEQAATTYKVSRGDTLFKIAKSFEIAVDDLIAANSISNPNQLTIGQSLTIPLVAVASTSSDGQPKIIKKVINTTLTAYTAGFESTGKKASHPTYGITYSGIKAKEGRTIAVDPAVIPLGSTVFIEGIGIRKAEDIGSAIRGSRIDVFMNDLGQAQEFGVKKNVKVYVLDRETV